MHRSLSFYFYKRIFAVWNLEGGHQRVALEKNEIETFKRIGIFSAFPGYQVADTQDKIEKILQILALSKKFSDENLMAVITNWVSEKFEFEFRRND